MRIAGVHITFGLDDTGIQQGFVIIRKQGVAAVPNGLTGPERRDIMNDCLILARHRESGTRTFGQFIDLFNNPVHGVFRENRCRPQVSSLIPDNQFVVVNPDGSVLQMMSKSDGAAQHHRFIHIGFISFSVMQCTFSTDRRRNDFNQTLFMFADTFRQ